MKKIILLALLASSLFTSAFAVSWSGLVDNNTKFSANDDFSQILLKQSNGVYLSLKTPVASNGNLLFTVEGLYKYTFDVNLKSNESKFTNIVDCDLLDITGSWKLGGGVLSLDAGRFFRSDFAGNAFAQVADGVLAGFTNSSFAANVYAGYTGLLNRLNVSMADSTSGKDDSFYALCAQYIPVMADFSYKTLFKKHTVGVQAEVFIPAADKLALKAYATLLVKGPITPQINYKASFTLGSLKFEKFMFDAIADVNFYVIKNSKLTAGLEYISSENGSILSFAPVTTRSIVNDSGFAGGILPKLAFMYSKDALYLSATGKGVISMANNNTKFRGIDISADAVYNIFNDLSAGVNVAAFIGFDEAKKAGNYSATLKAKLAF